MPRTVGERFKLVGLLAAYFTQNPGYENADPKVKVTAAEAKRLADASKAADDAVSPADAAANAKKKEREAAEEELRGTMRVLIGILGDKLAPDDSRWADFGLWQPAADSTPAVPINVTATIVEGPAVLCECDAVQKAKRYRWRTRLVGAPDFTLAASTADPMAQIANVVPGQTIEIIVQAVNGSAQGLPSGPVKVKIPMPESAPTVREVVSNGTDENGATSAPKPNRSHANGNGAHARA